MPQIHPEVNWVPRGSELPQGYSGAAFSRETTDFALFLQNAPSDRIVGPDLTKLSIVRDTRRTSVDCQLTIIVYDRTFGWPMDWVSVSSSYESQSTEESEMVPAEAALKSSVKKALDILKKRTRPIARVLSTRITEATIDAGTQEGFHKGQRVLVTIGRDVLTFGKVIGVARHSGTIRVDRFFHPMDSRDGVWVIYPKPD